MISVANTWFGYSESHTVLIDNPEAREIHFTNCKTEMPGGLTAPTQADGIGFNVIDGEFICCTNCDARGGHTGFHAGASTIGVAFSDCRVSKNLTFNIRPEKGFKNAGANTRVSGCVSHAVTLFDGAPTIDRDNQSVVP